MCEFGSCIIFAAEKHRAMGLSKSKRNVERTRRNGGMMEEGRKEKRERRKNKRRKECKG